MDNSPLLTLSALCMLALAVAGCSHSSVPDGVMSESQMVDFLEQAYLLEGFYFSNAASWVPNWVA